MTKTVEIGYSYYALMLSHSLKDAKYNLDIITQITRDYGLEINSEKSCVMIFNVREQPEHLCNKSNTENEISWNKNRQ